MVSLVDQLGDGLSSVYTFFDPGVAGMSYGTYNVLWQIERCKALGLPYPVPRHTHRREPEMAYKATSQCRLRERLGGVWQEAGGGIPRLKRAQI
jgi:arginine-tRNA-protein transferase